MPRPDVARPLEPRERAHHGLARRSPRGRRSCRSRPSDRAWRVGSMTQPLPRADHRHAGQRHRGSAKRPAKSRLICRAVAIDQVPEIVHHHPARLTTRQRVLPRLDAIVDGVRRAVSSNSRDGGRIGDLVAAEPNAWRLAVRRRPGGSQRPLTSTAASASSHCRSFTATCGIRCFCTAARYGRTRTPRSCAWQCPHCFSASDPSPHSRSNAARVSEMGCRLATSRSSKRQTRMSGILSVSAGEAISADYTLCPASRRKPNRRLRLVLPIHISTASWYNPPGFVSFQTPHTLPWTRFRSPEPPP